jgi:hypothetical protein
MEKTKTKENNNNVLKKGISMIIDAEDLLKASQSFCEGYENQNVKEEKKRILWRDTDSNSTNSMLINITQPKANLNF